MKNRDLIIEQNHTLMALNIVIPLSNIHISEGTMHTFMRQWTVQGIDTFPPKKTTPRRMSQASTSRALLGENCIKTLDIKSRNGRINRIKKRRNISTRE